MGEQNKIHWKAPAVIISSYLGACAFAVAHHVFNAALNGSEASSDGYQLAGFELTPQMASLAAGFSFAFLFRACLIIAVSAAYTQCLWRAIGQTGVKTRLATLDHLHSMLENIWSLLRVRIWWKYPLLTVLAIIAWILPVASVIAPATLTIVSAPYAIPPSYLLNVPRADYRSLRFLAAPFQSFSYFIPNNPLPSKRETRDTHDWVYPYNGPSYMAERIAFSVASQGSIMAIQPPFMNATWSTETHAPSIQCTDVTGALRTQIRQNIFDAYTNGTACVTPYNFLSWTANPGTLLGSDLAGARAYNDTSVTPFNQLVNISTTSMIGWPMNVGTIGPFNYSGVWTHSFSNYTDVATLYFSVMPHMGRLSPGDCGDYVKSVNANSSLLPEGTILQCELHNTTYKANFSYFNGEQKVDMEAQTQPVPNAVHTMVGAQSNTADCPTFNGDGVSCVLDPVTLERMSYQALMDAFGRVFVGSINFLRFDMLSIKHTNVMRTVLLDTPELNFLVQDSQWTINSSMDMPVMHALRDNVGPTGNMSMKAKLEELFQNMTLSMMSSTHFQPDPSSIFAPSKVNVTEHRYRNVYAYSPSKLWLSYGIAIFVAGLACFAGFISMHTNGASFSASFSTILRAGRMAEVSERVKTDDVHGRDPLPKYLQNATVKFSEDVPFWQGQYNIPSGRADVVETMKSGNKQYVRVHTNPVN